MESLFFKAAALCLKEMKGESNLVREARAVALHAANDELTSISALTPAISMSLLDAVFDRASPGAAAGYVVATA